MLTPTSGKNMSPRQVIINEARIAVMYRGPPGRSDRGWPADDERDRRALAVVEGAVLAPGRGDHRLARLDGLLVGAHAEAAAPLEHVVDLVLIHVAVRRLGLARRDAVEVELGARRRGERDLRHLVGLELHVVLHANLHGPGGLEPSTLDGWPETRRGVAPLLISRPLRWI